MGFPALTDLFHQDTKLGKGMPFTLSFANSASRSHLDFFPPWMLGSAQSISRKVCMAVSTPISLMPSTSVKRSVSKSWRAESWTHSLTGSIRLYFNLLKRVSAFTNCFFGEFYGCLMLAMFLMSVDAACHVPSVVFHNATSGKAVLMLSYTRVSRQFRDVGY